METAFPQTAAAGNAARVEKLPATRGSRAHSTGWPRTSPGSTTEQVHITESLRPSFLESAPRRLPAQAALLLRLRVPTDDGADVIANGPGSGRECRLVTRDLRHRLSAGNGCQSAPNANLMGGARHFGNSTGLVALVPWRGR